MKAGRRGPRLSDRRRARMLAGDRRGSVPAAVALLAFVGLAFLVVPTAGLLIRAPWHSLWQILTDADAGTALRLSLECATLSMLACIVFGVPLAWVLARARLPGLPVVRAFALLPLVLPPVAGGVALFTALGRRGYIGRYLDQWFGFTLPFTTTGVVVAESFVALPFLVFTVEGALRSTDIGLEHAAQTLGAQRWTVLRRVVLPQIGPSLAAGCVLCWARALGEFGATIVFAGNFPGRTQTMPIVVSLALDDSPAKAIALSLVLQAVSLTVLVVLRDRWLRPLAAP